MVYKAGGMMKMTCGVPLVLLSKFPRKYLRIESLDKTDK